MPVLSCYVAGVSATAIEYITEAVNSAFGECNIEEIGRDYLRYKVRTASRVSSIVLVVLDTASMEACKDIENGLFSSSRFYHYVGMKELVQFLNESYDLNLEYTEDDIFATDNEGTYFEEGTDSELTEKYLSIISDKDAIIKNLTAQIEELRGIIQSSGLYEGSNNDSKINELQEEVLRLNGIVADRDSRIDTLSSSLDEKSSVISTIESSNATLQGKVTSLETDKININKELAEEKVLSSKKSAVIKGYEVDLEAANSKITYLTGKVEESDEYKRQLNEMNAVSESLRLELSQKDVEIGTKDSEIERLRVLADGKNTSDEKVEELQKLLKTANDSLGAAKKSADTMESRYNDLLVKYSDMASDYETEKERADKYESKYQESETYLAEANQTCVELREELRILKSTTSTDDGVRAVMADLSELRRKYSDLMSNVFSVISSKALPKSGVKVPNLLFPDLRYKNIRFVFSGGTESRKGTYKCLYKELSSSKNKYLIVDVTSETAIDYVFRIDNVVDGLNWYSSGGSVQRYISQSYLQNVRVLSPKMGYINDSFFLTINWEKRLFELENSGYNVIIYCGDLSNLVSRVLFEAFSYAGNTEIYVHGNVLGSRALLANAGGLAGVKNCEVLYYDYDKNINRFYEWMSKKCACRIVSRVGT